MKKRRGRPSKKLSTPDIDELNDIIEGIRYAYIFEDKDSLFEQMMRLKSLSQERFPSENLDRVLAKPFQINAHSKDFIQKQADEKLVQDFYYTTPSLFGFKSIDEFKHVSSLITDLNFTTSSYNYAKDKGRLDEKITLSDHQSMSIKKAYEFIIAEAEKFEHLFSRVEPFRNCLSGIPRDADIKYIVQAQKLEKPTANETHMNQNHGDGEALAKRLRILLRIKKETNGKSLIWDEFLDMKRGRNIPII